ncbi:MAG: TatD family hydrolase [Prevotellaceae bacterium]|nr:TatD family hydrolase [Prevotellaceae bacterium]
MIPYIDTHTHLDGEEFIDDIAEVVQRCKDAGCTKAFIPAIDLKGLPRINQLCDEYKGWAYPMIGLHPEEVKEDYKEILQQMHDILAADTSKYIAIGEVGVDFYWSRDFYEEQLEVFEEQVKWAVEFNLPLMIHCRKGQAEMVKILRKYEKELFGGVFHCFTGNEQEAKELLSFDRFVLGIGGVLTFKKSHLPEVLPAVVPLSRIVLETDSPYMAPVPKRGERNESSFIPYIISRLAEAYATTEEEICNQTNNNVYKLFKI